ncbi:MAG TPA: Rrf2 family transcriptional regulator [Acidimicrobiales bacterium]
MRVTARVDYAVRAMAELAAAEPGRPVKAERLAAAQGVPPRFLENLMGALRHGGLVVSQRGADGGYALARPASAIVLADVIQVIEGPIADVRGVDPSLLTYGGAAASLADVWDRVRTEIVELLSSITLADIAAGGAAGPPVAAGTVTAEAGAAR